MLVVCAAALADFCLLFLFIRAANKTSAQLSSLVFGNIVDTRNSASLNDTLSALAAHMNACRASRGEARVLTSDSRDHSLEFALKMKDSIYTTTRINGSVIAIHEKIEKLGNDILSSMSAIEEIAQTIESFSRQIETQSSSVIQTSAAIEEMDASIKSVRDITGKKSESVTALVNRTIDGRTRMEEMEKSIQEINRNIAAVHEINEVIDSIASQTNLLSMNAAIEAAHAGDAGKGFAVVADEIRKLSESTTENAMLIAKTLNRIVGNTRTVMEHSSLNLETYNAIVDESGQLADAFSEIHHATSELDIGSTEIVSATQTLIDITETIKNGSREIAVSAADIRNSIQRIVESSEDNKTETSRIADVAQELNLVFLSISEVFLKYENVVSRINKFQETEFADSADGSKLNTVPVMIQHLLWIIRARGVIDGKMEIDPNAVIDHTSCHLGKWIANGAPESLKKDEKFRRLVSDHERMHAIVKDIVGSAKTDQRKELEKKFDELLNYSAGIIETLKGLAKN